MWMEEEDVPEVEQEAVMMLPENILEPIKERARVILGCVETVGKVWVSLETALGEVEQVQELLADSGELPLLPTVKVGDVAVTRFSEDGALYRCRVEAKLEDNVIVRFLDFGNIEDKTEDELLEMPVAVKDFAFGAMMVKVETTKDDTMENRDDLQDILEVDNLEMEVNDADKATFFTCDLQVFPLKKNVATISCPDINDQQTEKILDFVDVKIEIQDVDSEEDLPSSVHHVEKVPAQKDEEIHSQQATIPSTPVPVLVASSFQGNVALSWRAGSLSPGQV